MEGGYQSNQGGYQPKTVEYQSNMYGSNNIVPNNKMHKKGIQSHQMQDVSLPIQQQNGIIQNNPVQYQSVQFQANQPNPSIAVYANQTQFTPNDPSSRQPVVNNPGNSNQAKGEEKFADLPDAEKMMRIGFIRKVYGILSIQLIITVGLACLSFIPVVKAFLINYFYVFWVAVGLGIVLMLVLICCKKVSRKVPLNYILLFLWTLAESYMLATACAFYDYDIVLSAMGITAGLVVGLTTYACFTKTNFTWIGGILCGLVMIMVMMTIFGFIWNKWMRVVYCAIGVFVFSLYIIYDTQNILGKFKARYTIDDYIVAAMNLYFDIINLFLMVLGIFGAVQS